MCVDVFEAKNPFFQFPTNSNETFRAGVPTAQLVSKTPMQQIVKVENSFPRPNTARQDRKGCLFLWRQKYWLLMRECVVVCPRQVLARRVFSAPLFLVNRLSKWPQQETKDPTSRKTTPGTAAATKQDSLVARTSQQLRTAAALSTYPSPTNLSACLLPTSHYQDLVDVNDEENGDRFFPLLAPRNITILLLKCHSVSFTLVMASFVCSRRIRRGRRKKTESWLLVPFLLVHGLAG